VDTGAGRRRRGPLGDPGACRAGAPRRPQRHRGDPAPGRTAAVPRRLEGAAAGDVPGVVRVRGGRDGAARRGRCARRAVGAGDQHSGRTRALCELRRPTPVGFRCI